MTNLTGVVRQLQQERARAAKEVEQLDVALAALNGGGTGRRGRLSAAARARIAAAQRARWAKLRSNAQPKTNITTPKRRTMSVAARKKIAAAQRARWAKSKAAKEGKAA
jgi:hypothetical protein